MPGIIIKYEVLGGGGFKGAKKNLGKLNKKKLGKKALKMYFLGYKLKKISSPRPPQSYSMGEKIISK